MSEMSAGLRALEMAERQRYHRERAHRELIGTTQYRTRSRLFASARERLGRRAA